MYTLIFSIDASNNITSATTTDTRVITGTPSIGFLPVSINPSGSLSPLTTLKDYTVFGYNNPKTKWVEIPRVNLDMGGKSVGVEGSSKNILIRKQRGSKGKISEDKILLPADISTFGSVLNFTNIANNIFGFTTTNVYIQLIFTSNYPFSNTKWTGWNPATVPGLSLWLDAAEPGPNGFTPNTGIPVTTWKFIFHIGSSQD